MYPFRKTLKYNYIKKWKKCKPRSSKVWLSIVNVVGCTVINKNLAEPQVVGRKGEGKEEE